MQQPVLGSWLHCFGNIEPTAEPPVLTEQDIDVQLMSFAALEKTEPKVHSHPAVYVCKYHIIIVC